MIVLGLSALSITPLCCTCLEQLSFPIPESLSINFMFFTSNLFSLLISILVTMPEMGNKGTWILVITIFPFFIYVVFCYKTDFLKSQHEGIYGSFNRKFLEKEEEKPIKEEKTERKVENLSEISENDEISKNLTQISDEEDIIHAKNN